MEDQINVVVPMSDSVKLWSVSDNGGVTTVCLRDNSDAQSRTRDRTMRCQGVCRKLGPGEALKCQTEEDRACRRHPPEWALLPHPACFWSTGRSVEATGMWWGTDLGLWPLEPK